MRHKAVFTTGEAAGICRLSQQTIIRCFDSGQLEGFRVPGSKFRRIPRASLLKFMKDNGIPLDSMGEGKIKVLIVDDEPEVVKLFEQTLAADSRFETATASTGYEAGVLTQQFRPDVVLLDLMLPDINGQVVCRTIRENPELAGTRVIILSGAMADGEAEVLLAAGADECINKPFNVEKVIETIVKLVEA